MTGIFFNNLETSFVPHILKELYIEKVYAPYLEGRKDLVILDIGGNVGLFSLYASKFAKTIYTVEPAQQHIAVMKHMIQYNKLQNIIPIKAAISHMNEDMVLFHNTNETMFSLNKMVDNTGESEVVRAMTLDVLLNDLEIPHVDFMKLDVEGAEAEIIGSEGFEKACKKIDAMVIEYHSWSSRNPSQLVNTLSDYGYKVKTIPADATLFYAER